MTAPTNSPVTVTLRRWKPYPKYKDSGVEWLGKIPMEWRAAPLKRRYTVQLGKMLQNDPGSPGDTRKPYLRAANIAWNGVDLSDLKEMWLSVSDQVKFALVPDDLLVSEGGDVGRSTLWKGELPECYIQNAINRVRSRGEASTAYLYYWLYTIKHAGFVDVLCEKSTIKHFTAEKVSEIPTPLPEKREQACITAFLDHETAKIDSLIGKKERLIELLQENRAALITQAVTRGLDHDAPLKPAGNEWLDKYPTHWRGMPLKRWVATKVTDGPHETPELLPDGVDFVSAEAMQDGTINFEARRGFITKEQHQEYCKKCNPKRDDIFLCKSGATTGKLAYVDTDLEFSVWSPLALIRVDRSKVLPRFMFTTLQAVYVQRQIQRTWSAGTQPNISMGAIERLFLVIPPIEEQISIMEQLGRRTLGIDALITKIHSAITLLQEYRTALISAAVTGKIDVREAA